MAGRPEGEVVVVEVAHEGLCDARAAVRWGEGAGENSGETTELKNWDMYNK